MKKIDQNTIQQLKYTKISNRALDLSKFPDFLILGPQRTASTWLSQNLRSHPEILFSTPKELHFFNRLLPDHPYHRSSELTWYLNFFEESSMEYIKKNWRMLKNYREFYRPQCRGEGTASYAALSKDIIKEIVTLNPDIKAILMVRNPVMRGWSHAKKDLLNKSLKDGSPRRISEVSDQEFKDFFSSKYQVACGHYTLIIENWLSFLKKDHLLVILFDDVVEKPREILIQTFEFLGVTCKQKYLDSSKVGMQISATDLPSQKRELPLKYKQFLEELFKEELVKLEKLFGRVPVR